MLICFWFLWEITNHLPTNVLSYDVYGAYLHLPANFIYEDPFLTDWSWIEAMNEKYNATPTYYQFWGADTGRQVIKYPLGFAVIYAPFFFVGHWLAPFFGFDQDGFSAPYHFSIIVGHCVYIILGLWMARKVLLHFFSGRLTALLLLILFAGTNFFFTTTASLAMPHGHLFLFYGLVLWFTIRWHEKQNWKNTLLLGGCIGLAALIRATEILIVLIPLFWQVVDRKSWFEKWQQIKKEKHKLFGLALLIASIGSIQLIYYKLTTGHFFIDAYNNAGEGFDFSHPYTWQFLFSARKGWLVYTPIFIFSFFGFWLMHKRKHPAVYALMLFFLVNLYVLSSWTCWWYAESFGQRSLVQSYLVLLIPLGYFLRFVIQQKFWLKSTVFVAIILFVAFNQFQTWQMHRGLLHPSRMTNDAYWAHFLATKPVENFADLLLTDKSVPANEMLAQKGDQLNVCFLRRYEIEDGQWGQTNQEFSDTSGYRLNELEPYSPDIKLNWEQITNGRVVIFEFSVLVYFEDDLNVVSPSLVFKMLYNKKLYHERYLNLNEVENLSVGAWNELRFIEYSNDIRDPRKTEIQFFAWVKGKGEIKIDNVCVKVYEGLK